MQRERMWSAGAAVAVVALVAWSSWLRWQALAASPFPVGVDGYYYPIQVRALLETGALHYPASPLTFWFMLPFAALTDPITGAKLGAAIGGAALGLPAYALGARLGRGRGPGLIAAATATASAGSAYLTIEFVKQGIGLTVALTAVWLVLRALDVRSDRRIAAAIAAIGAALLTHKLAAALVIAVAIPAAIENARQRGELRGRRLLYLVGAVFGLAMIAVGLGAVMPERFLSSSDLALLGDLFSHDAHWSAPALDTEQLSLAFDYEAAIGAVIAIGAAIALVQRPKPRPRDGGDVDVRIAGADRVVALSFIALGLAIGLPWLDVSDPQGLGFRLRIAAFVPLALCAAIALGALATAIDRRWRDRMLIVVAVALVARAPRERSEGRVLAHPALVAAVIASIDQIAPGKTVIVPERHIRFMVAWYTRAPVSARPEPIPYANRVRMLPLALIGPGSPLDQALDAARIERGVEAPLGLHPLHRNGLVLVSEPTWDWLLARLPPSGQVYWRNWPEI